MVSNVGIDFRKIDKKGRIVLPQYWLKTHKLQKGMYVSVKPTDFNTDLIIRKVRIDEEIFVQMLEERQRE